MNFDKEINKILEETYFGGSPYEQISGIKKSITFEETEADTYTSDEIAAMQSLADAAAKFQSKVDTEEIAERGKTLISFLNTARDIYKSAAGPNQLGKVQAGVNRAIADPLSLYIIRLEYGDVSFNQDIVDEMIDSVLPTFINKQGDLAKGATEDDIIEKTIDIISDFRDKMAGFDFKQANVDLEKYHYDKDLDSYRYIFCGECEGENVQPRRIREADPVKGIEAKFAKGYGWDHNGFRIEAYSPNDLGEMASLYDNMDLFSVVTLVGPHTNSSQDHARIATIQYK